MSSVPESSEPTKGPPRVGSYRLLQSLGTGGMSSVFHAIHTETGHEVAVKVLPRSLAKNPTLLQRFLREAKSAEALEHPNIAAIYDRGNDQGRHYLVLELVAGGDLQERVKAEGPLPLTQATRVIRAVAEGLKYASGQGVIHRDIKPANLLLTPDGEVKIIDLGLALQADNEDERVTRDGTTVGTVDYMSPEQARDSRATSERSDMYSLGCTFFYLITGKPPYAGGNVPDKLGRHVTAPIPDVRELRPDASEPLARFIQKLMAKRAEGRFANYEAFINAIESLPEAQDDEPGETLEALIDDDDEISLVSDSPAGSNAAPPKPPVTSKPVVPPKAVDRKPEPPAKPIPSFAEVSLADLAELDADESRPSRSRPKQAPPSTTPAAATALIDDDDDDDEPGHSINTGAVRSVPGRDIPLSTWVAAGAILGLAIALLGFGVVTLLTPSDSPPIVVDEGGGANEATNGEETNPDGSPQRIDRPRPQTAASPIIAKPIVKPKPPVVAPVVWNEPADPVDAVPAEAVYPAAAEAAALPEWAKLPVATTLAGPTTLVQRVVDPAKEGEVSTLRQALDRPQGLIEIADNGPLFEDELRTAAKARIIRAKAGYRPMIHLRFDLEKPVFNRAAVLVLDAAKLTFEGIDLIIDSSQSPNTLTSIFHLKGAELTFKNCTINVLNASGKPLTFIKVDEPTDARPNRGSQIRFDNCNVRTTSKTLIDILGPCDVVSNRSMILSGAGEIISCRPSTGRGERNFYAYRSLVAARGAVLDLPGNKSMPSNLISLGSTLAKFVGVNESGLIRTKVDPTGAIDQIATWRSFGDAVIGWPALLSHGERETASLANLTAGRSTWKAIDTSTRESRTGWNAALVDEFHASGFSTSPDVRGDILARAAWPNPSLLPATVRAFTAPFLPGLPGRATAAPRNAMIPGVTASYTKTSPSSPAAKKPASYEGKDGELFFLLDDAEFQGDLGLYLARKVTAGKKARIKVLGNGHTPRFTPVQLPDGATVEIEVAADAGHEPVWTPASGARGAALISISKGYLSIKGLFVSGATSSALPYFIRVDDGHLLLTHCSFRAAGNSAGSGVVLFHAPGTKPLELGAGPFLSISDRPIAQISDSAIVVSNGEAIAAELGRGIVSLKNTAILSDGDTSAIDLRPQKVARQRFETDLLLDRCSIAAEGNFVTVGAWPGTEPGPDRPWLVSSHESVFVDMFDRGRRLAVLLRSRTNGMPHGAVFWQSRGDAYDLANFTALGDAPPVARPTRPDVRVSWTNLWGSNHIFTPHGPTPRKNDAVLTFVARDRPKPGTGSVDALKLDESGHPNLGADLKTLPTRALPAPSGFRF